VAEIDGLKRRLAQLDCVSRGGFRIRGRKSSLSPVRWRPERRFIASARLALKNDATNAVEDLSVFLRLFPDARGAAIARAAGHLHAAGIRIPKPLGCLEGGRLYVEELIVGEPFLDEHLRGQARPEDLADVVAAFHATPLPSDLARRFPGDALAAAIEDADELGRRSPRIRSLVESIAARLSRDIPSGPVAFIHGDLHFHQVLVTADGPKIVDLERAGAGDPLEDVGNFVAHLLDLGRLVPAAREGVMEFEERFLGRWFAASDARHARRPRSDLEFFVGLGFLRLSVLPFRRGDSHWEARSTATLEFAREWLLRDQRESGRPLAGVAPRFFAEGAPGADAAWAVFHPRKDGPWPGHLGDENGSRTYGVYDPALDAFREVPPSSDPALDHGSKWFETGEIVSCRSGRRAVVRVSTADPPVYVKICSRGRAKRLVSRHRLVEALAASAGSARFPRFAPILDDRDAGILVFQSVEGASLHDLLIAGTARAALEATAVALAGFHCREVDPEALPASHAPADLEALAQILVRHRRDLAGMVESAFGRLSPASPAARSGWFAVHGDLHDRNVLCSGSGITLLDLDLFHAGDPAEDVGNFAAHLILRSLQRGAGADEGRAQAAAFFESWRNAGGKAASSAVRIERSRALFRLACLYAFRRRWQHLVPDLLAEAVWVDR
jgi:aminoglycoside phosphotransferase (APT) family kinase protein